MYSSSPNDEAYVDTDSEIFKKYLRSVYKELHADRETGC